MSNSIRQPRPRTVKHKHRVSRKQSRIISFAQLASIINGISLIGLAMVLPDNVSITPRVGMLMISAGLFTLAIGLQIYIKDSE